MNSLASVCEFLFSGFPTGLDNLRVVQLVVNAVAPKHYEVIIVLDFEAFDVWRGDDHLWISEILGALGLDISEGARHGESAWEYSMWPKKYLLTHYARLGILVLYFGN